MPQGALILVVLLLPVFLSGCSLRRFLRFGSAFKVGSALLVQALVLAGFLTIPSSELPEAAAEVKR